MIVKLSEIAQIIMGQSPDGDSYNTHNIGIPLLNGAADYKGNLFNPKKFTTQPTRTALKGDILLGVRATIGNLAIADKDYCIGRGLAAIRVNKGVVKEYLIHYLSQQIDKLIQDSSGSTIKGIVKEDLYDMKIPLPSLPIQKRIAEILDAADALKRKDQQLLKKYDELAQAIFIDMFGDPVQNEKGWRLKTIGEVCYYVKDGPHVSPKYTNSGIPFISVNNIIKGSIDLSNSKYISREDYEMYCQKGKPEKNDVLYTKGGTTGFAKRVDVDYEFMQWVHVALLKFDKGIINPVFFEYMLNSAYCYHQSQLLTKGIANRDLVLGEMKKIIILFPPINTQIEFATKISVNENMKKIEGKAHFESQTLFNALIQKAFNQEK